MDQRILFPKRDLSPHYSASDSEEKEFSDDDDDRNHKHRRRETQPHSQERNLEEGSIQPYRNRNKPFENGHPHREATPQSNEAWRNYNMPPLEKHFPENFDKRRHGSTAVSRAPLDLNQRVRGNQSWTGDPGSGRGRGRELGPWSIHDSRFNSLDFNPAIVQQGYVPSSLFAGRGMPTVSNSQSASWNAFGLVQGLPNGGLDSLHSIGLQRTLRPSSMNMGIPHQRCRDFEERGFCLRGDMCPMEHGINRIVVEDVQSLSQFNLPVSIPSAHLMGASAVPGPLSAVSAPNTSGNGQGVYNKSSKAGAEDVGLDLTGAADGSAVASGADFYDPDQPLWTSDCARTSSTILTPDPTKANRGDNQAGLPHDAEMGLYSGLDDERPIKYTGDALGSHNTNLPVRGQIGASENRINSGHIGSVTYEDQLLDTAKDAVGHHGKISKADDIVSHATDLSMKTLNNSAHFVQKPSQKAQCTLFVSGVPHIDNKRDALLSHFQKFGEVINIYIPSNSERAFVQFSKREEAEDALKAPDAVMGNRFIKLWWANRDNIPLDKVNSTIASRVVAAASVPYNPDAAIKEKDISKGSSFHDSISAGISSDRPKSVLTNGPPPPVQKKVENLDYLKEIRKKQEMLDKKRNEFKQALEKLEKQKQATGIKAELTAEQTAKRQKTKTVTDIHTAGSPSSIGSSCIVSSTQAELTDRSRSEGNAKPHKSNTSTMVALTESSSFKPSPHQQAPAAPPFVVNRFKLDNRPTSFKIASPLPNGLANVSALKEHFSTFGELSNVDLEDIKVEDNAAESAGSNKRACIYFTTRQSQGCILGASTLDNIEEWKWKLSKLIRNKDEQEVGSRERKDRRDFQQISALAVRMGLYSQQYSKVVVISKVPLPNYRSDLDDRRPQRKVVLPYGLEDQLVAYLKKYIGGKSMNKDFGLDNSVSRSSHEGNLATNQGIYWQEEPITRTSHVAEKILHRRSLEILNKQQSWQNSLEGQKMLEFRKSLPAYKEKDSLLRQIAQNQLAALFVPSLDEFLQCQLLKELLQREGRNWESLLGSKFG